jgi:5-methylcytosine-specific restriction protein A
MKNPIVGKLRPTRASKTTDPFYLSKEWRAVRLAALKRDGFRCVVCRRSVAGKGEARVDHIIPRSQGGAALDQANLRTLCAAHDNQAHREKSSGGGGGPRVERFIVKGLDADGRPLDPNHPWRRRG